jgi:hypothetical protein|tara:strand:+ start:397 stop:918 length:522 start_codon:yes stop_codon:yes gene_type:complete
MKNKNLIFVSLLVLLISCSLMEEDDFTGITFDINNNTDIVYTNASITIGGMKNGEFIGTETYDFPSLTITGTNEWNTYNRNDEEGGLLVFAYNSGGRWKPNIDLIRNIPSEKAYFKLILEDGNETLLQNVNEDGVLTTLVSREIPKGYMFNNDGGSMYIGIWEEGVIARFYGN